VGITLVVTFEAFLESVGGAFAALLISMVERWMAVVIYDGKVPWCILRKR
jgi:hypothetical protein